MDEFELLGLLIHGNQLKRTIRTGWYQHGITDAENVAAHSFGVSFIALAMAKVITAPLDLEKLLAMAILHDLPEALTSDIPAPAWQFLPPGVKTDVEREALQIIVGQSRIGPSFTSYWEELHANDSDEARLVHDCDKLDMCLQAFMYERQTGNRQLEEFWSVGYEFAFHETQAVFGALSSLKEQE